MDFKSAGGRIKRLDEHTGELECVFSTLGVRDHDGDITLPGAIKNGQEVALSQYGHAIWEGGLPVGKGTITADDREATFTGQVFMDIPTARDTFLAIKGMGARQEWSYGFIVLDSENGEHNGERGHLLKSLEVFEVSPVLRGAGIGTRTTSAKGMRVGEKPKYDPATLAELGRKTMDELRTILGFLHYEQYKERESLHVMRLRLIRDQLAADMDEIARQEAMRTLDTLRGTGLL